MSSHSETTRVIAIAILAIPMVLFLSGLAGPQRWRAIVVRWWRWSEPFVDVYKQRTWPVLTAIMILTVAVAAVVVVLTNV
jgi:hypothetical protein